MIYLDEKHDTHPVDTLLVQTTSSHEETGWSHSAYILLIEYGEHVAWIHDPAMLPRHASKWLEVLIDQISEVDEVSCLNLAEQQLVGVNVSECVYTDSLAKTI